MHPQLSSALADARVRELRQTTPHTPGFISRLLAARAR